MIKTLTLAILMIASTLTGIDPVKNSTKESSGLPTVFYTLGVSPVNFTSINLVGLEDTTFTNSELATGSRLVGYVPSTTMHVERSAAGVCPGCTPTVSFQFNSEAPVFVTVSSHDTLYYSLYEYETLGRVKITAIWPGQCITNSSNTCVENYGCASNWFVWLIGIPGTYLGYDVYENGTFQYHTDPIDHEVLLDPTYWTRVE